MGRTKKTSAKVLVHPSEASPKKRRKGAQPTGNTTLPVIDKIKERAKQQHKHASSTRKNYSSYVDRGQKWLKVHASTTSCKDEETHDSDAYEDPTFRDALEEIPNQHSDKALALFLSYKCFHENNGQSTCDGIHAAFKKYWEEAAGDTYRGKWHFNEVRKCWEGNPACSAEVQDVIKSVRHKANSEGADRTHSVAMSKGFMDRILTWIHKRHPRETYTGLVRMLLEGDKLATDNLTLELRTSITRVVMYQAFSTTAWNLWTRCFELIKLKRKDLTIDLSEVGVAFRKYLCNETPSIKDLHAHFEVFLSNRKGWQRKVDKGLKEADPRSNRYKIYPQPDIPGCDCFFWMLLWLALLERVHYNSELEPDDFVFPAISSNGIVHRGEHISHDAVQAWIDEATTGAGIPRGVGDSFTTHTYRRGGAQWRWMFTPVGERWTLARVRWWGSWAENENRDTLIQYLLDELSTYENDHSDALCPTQNEADGSLLGEHQLVKPACSQDLQLMQQFITADVADLRSDIRILTNAFRPLCAGTSFPRESPTFVPQQTVPASGPSRTLNPTTNSAGTTNFGSRPLPEKGLDIPNLPVRCADGSYAPKKDSWKYIVQHWTEADPGRGLHVALRDWPAEWLRGKNKAIFGSKYHQRALIALEFLEQYQGNESVFLAAYPECTEGHTALLAAVKRAKKDRGEIIPRK
ncbi:hypothetical protein EV702DRAFT_1193898 [Suillus placidus]|uniref:Uncharacterized protein n=1 Tax=Suillus placidus TaxID=48579 RepID=A0A9P7A431_9AGAM|nr:hypothetical protein EV702DRAFT_1193898 [Suillus placidus]